MIKQLLTGHISMMKSNRKSCTLLLSLLIGLFAFGGCGEQKKTTSQTETEYSSDTAATTMPGTTTEPSATPSTDLPSKSPDPDVKAEPSKTDANITISFPKSGTAITTSQILITGTARTFENGVAYRILDASGKKIAEGHGTAVGEMGQHNPYSIPVKLKEPLNGKGEVQVFEYSAKDGSEINKVRVPVEFKIGEASNVGEKEVKVYFTSSKSATDCKAVAPVLRKVGATSAIASATVAELLRGPTTADRSKGLSTQIPAGTTLNKVVIQSGVANVDLSGPIKTVAGSCKVLAIRSQIESTLRQFSTVSKVVISVDGNSAQVLQP